MVSIVGRDYRQSPDTTDLGIRYSFLPSLGLIETKEMISRPETRRINFPHPHVSPQARVLIKPRNSWVGLEKYTVR